MNVRHTQKCTIKQNHFEKKEIMEKMTRLLKLHKLI